MSAYPPYFVARSREPQKILPLGVLTDLEIVERGLEVPEGWVRSHSRCAWVHPDVLRSERKYLSEEDRVFT